MKLSLKLQLWAWALVLLLLASPLAAKEEEGLDVTVRSFVIMDANTGDILLSYNPQLFWPPASTLKVMTAIYVMEHLKMDDKVTVSPYAAAASAHAHACASCGASSSERVRGLSARDTVEGCTPAASASA